MPLWPAIAWTMCGGTRGVQQEGHAGVPQVVEPDGWETSARAAEVPVPVQVPRLDRSAVRGGEHQAGVLPGRSDGQTLSRLPGAVLLERVDGCSGFRALRA